MSNRKFSKVVCLECDKLVSLYIPTFFMDKEGAPMYGAVCPTCYEKVKNRKIITLGHDAVRKPIDVAKEALNTLTR